MCSKDFQWWGFEGDSTVSAASGTAPNRDVAGRDMMHYTMVYGDDGPVRFRMESDGNVLRSGTWDKHKVWKKGPEYMAMHEEL